MVVSRNLGTKKPYDFGLSSWFLILGSSHIGVTWDPCVWAIRLYVRSLDHRSHI